MEQNFDIRIYIDFVKRRFFYITIPAALVFILVVVIAFKLPPVYRSTATILVESQQIPGDLARSTVTGNADERIRSIEQRLMTRENVLDIVRTYNLYASDNISPTDKAARVRLSTRITRVAINTRNRRGRTIAFTVSFDDENQNTSARVANEFATRILEQNIQSRSQRANQTHEFFDRLVRQLETEISDVSTEILDFKRANKETLPETLEVRRERLATLIETRARTEQRYTELKLQLESVGTGDLATARKLREAHEQLAQMRAYYTDSHPSVKKLLVQIQYLESVAQPLPRPKPEQGDTGDLSVSELQQAGNSLLSSTDEQLDAMVQRLQELDSLIVRLEETIDKTPETGMALAVLNRELKNLNSEHRQVILKRTDAETGERLEEDRQAERFEIIDRATPPSEPIKPDRQKIILAGFFGSGAIGIGLAVLLELLNTGIRGESGLVKKIHVKPIVSIPYISTKAERNRKFRKWAFLVLLATALLILLLLTIHLYYKPLDIFVYKIIGRAGL